MLFRLTGRLLRCNCGATRQQRRFYPKYEDDIPDDRDAESKTTHVNMLSTEDDGYLYIHEYSNVGFTMRSGLKILGPTVFFPRSFFSWKINSAKEISDKSLSLFSMLHPKLDLLVIGKGDISEEVNPGVISYLRKNKINFEVLTSEQAMATFNFLNKEQRWVAAAIIPPQFVTTQTQTDIQEYFAEMKKEANLIIEGPEEQEQIEPPKKEVNIFGYEIIKSPLEDHTFVDFIESAKVVKGKKSKQRKDSDKSTEAKTIQTDSSKDNKDVKKKSDKMNNESINNGDKK